MGIPLFRVQQPGLLTTIQDQGRYGRQRDGMAVAGAMDSFASQVANLLVGSRRSDAVLEITLRGPTLEVLADVTVALCGADLTAHHDDNLPLPLWRTNRLLRGQTVRFGARRAGARAYLAIEGGGFDVPLALGSRATFLRAAIGGFAGRALRAGDVLHGFAPGPGAASGRALASSVTPHYGAPCVARIVLGPHWECFAAEARTRNGFLGTSYVLSPRSDRMGFRLDGRSVAYAPDWPGSLLSEAAPPGGIQIPPDGQPIVLMADRQTTGGYPLIGVVIAADLPCLAQLAPGDALSFRAVPVEEAQELYCAQERLLRLLERGTAI